MKKKKESGIVVIDAVIATMAIMAFSILILSLIRNNIMENVKLKKETLAMIYITEIFENIAIEDYDNITEENISALVPQIVRNSYEVELEVEDNFEEIIDVENIIKKITIKLSFEVNGKNYNCSMQRMKIKE